MKINILILAFTLFLCSNCTTKITFDPPPPPIVSTDLMISEIATFINTDPAAGALRNHYVELFNGTANRIDLSNYAIGYMAVTDTATLGSWNFAVGSFLTLRRNLDTGRCFVIASPQSSTTFVRNDTTWGTTSTLTAQASSPLQLSGNSAIALLKKDIAGTIVLNTVNYRIIDVFGSPLVKRNLFQGASSARNNIFWPLAGETLDTRNRTFFRKKTVISPTINWALAAGTTADNSEWRLTGDRAWDYANIGLKTQ